MKKALCVSIILLIFTIFCLSAFAQDKKNRNKKIREVMLGLKSKENPFGVLEFLPWNHAWNSYKYPDKKALKKAVGLMKESGVGWVRMDFLWQDIEPKQGEFDFSKYDLIVDLLRQHNINILGLLGYSADWASPNRKWNYPSVDTQAFINYAVQVVSRYKDKIKYWEVWNEPDSATYWEPQDGLKTYCVLLKDVYLALKDIDPECKILNGGLANGIASVNHLYDHGAKDYFDILNIHLFESPLNPAATKRISPYPKLAYKIMSRNGDGQKKIWITEIGCPGVKKGLRVANWWMGQNPDEKEQAQWLREVYTRLLAVPEVEKVFWAYFRDCNRHWDNGIDYFGLVRWDFSKKPAFRAYRDSRRKLKKVK